MTRAEVIRSQDRQWRGFCRSQAKIYARPIPTAFKRVTPKKRGRS